MAAFVSKKYSYRNGAVSRGVSAQTVGEVFESIVNSGEELTSRSFLDASRPVDSPTHNIFEWDDSIAAENWRLHESKNIINSIEIEYVQVEEPETQELEIEFVEHKDPIPNFRGTAFVNVNPRGFGKTANFVPIETAMKNDDMRSQVLKNALSELKSFKHKYATLNELAKVIQSIDDVISEYGEEE